MEKITKKEMFNTIKNAMADRADVVAFCDHEIELIEKKAAKAKEAAAKKRAEGDELTDVVFSLLNDEPQTIADIAGQIEGEDVTPSKVSYRLTSLVKAGKAQKTDLKIEAAEGGKARTVKGYFLA
jgi:hypothetical protein